MIRVFLVEDEEAMRENIKKNIEWETCGLKLEGEAGDGETAYAMIQETRPDILITDIMMPFMNGLELCELVKLSQPGIKIIIVSGCRHFEMCIRDSPQYENDDVHQMEEKNTEFGNLEGIGSTRYAKQGGYFSYNMVVKKGQKNSLLCQFVKEDNGKTIKITVGDTVIACLLYTSRCV